MDELRAAPHQRNGKPKDGYSVSYRLLILMTLHEALAFAVRNGAIPSNPALDVAKPSKRSRRVRRAKRALSPAQVAVLRECVAEWENTRRSGPKRGPQLRLAIELGLATGCRIGEVCAFLLEEAVDVPQLRIAVTGTAVTIDGKLLRADELKGRDQARVLELPAWVLPTLDECRSLALRTGPFAPLLQGRRGALLSPSNLQNRMRSMREEQRERLGEAGIDVEELTFHTLRRTVLTAVDGVVGRALSQAQAGHKDARTTAGYIDAAKPLLVVTGTVVAIEAAFGRAS
ncbi:site-specific integrase [Microbacterium laevaniformans]|uniref:site-specific integrase n=1 Tax=Microbacterium laevaniformans TaxID=36807 RepID=UPI003D999EE1